MGDLVIYNDSVWTSPVISLVNTTTNAVTSLPNNSALTVTSSSPSSIAAQVVGLGNQIRLTPMVKVTTAVSITMACTGYATQVILVDVAADPNAPLQLTIDQNLADWTKTAQAIPTAPGP